MVIGSQVNRFLLKSRESRQILPVVLTVQATLTSLLVIGTILGPLPRFASLVFVFSHIFLIGLTNPNAAALALAPFVRNVGTASACLGSIQMGSGIVASGLLGVLHNGTAVPMVGMMAGFSILSLTFVLAARFAVPKMRGHGIE
jgi:MFS transporter, DHA1 family, multidrug resistance protein